MGGDASVNEPMREALEQLTSFPLLAALYGRRSRRFTLGGEIPDGPLAYRSQHEALPLSELERTLVLTAMGGTTGWHYAITRHERYAPHLANYAGGAAGRTFPSAAAFHTGSMSGWSGGAGRSVRFRAAPWPPRSRRATASRVSVSARRIASRPR